MKKETKILIFLLYFITLIYLMFFAFNRTQFLGATEYRYKLIPSRIPLWFPKSFSPYHFRLWLIALGNLACFIPFGFFLPSIWKQFSNNYLKFICIFIILIFSIEVLQMVTYLGSFDTEDIIVNTFGATIGYISYIVGTKAKGKKLLITSLSVIGLTILTFIISYIINNNLF